MNQSISLRDLAFELADSSKAIHNCSICKKLALSPEFCIICQEIFCKQCIPQTISDEKQQQQKCQHKTIEDKRTVILQQQLIVRCQNSGLGCQATLNYGELSNHIVNLCDYTKISCPNLGCPQTIMRNDVIHKKNCEHQMISCKFCKKQYKKSTSHDCYNDLIRTINQQSIQISTLEKKYQELQNLVKIKVDSAQVSELIKKNDLIQQQQISKQVLKEQEQTFEKNSKQLQSLIKEQMEKFKKDHELMTNENKKELKTVKDKILELHERVDFQEVKLEKQIAKNSKDTQQIIDDITKWELVQRKNNKSYHSTSFQENDFKKLSCLGLNEEKKHIQNHYFNLKTPR